MEGTLTYTNNFHLINHSSSTDPDHIYHAKTFRTDKRLYIEKYHRAIPVQEVPSVWTKNYCRRLSIQRGISYSSTNLHFYVYSLSSTNPTFSTPFVADGVTSTELLCQIFSLPPGFSVRRDRFARLSGLLASAFTFDSHEARRSLFLAKRN